jgi:N-acetyltransferase
MNEQGVAGAFDPRPIVLEGAAARLVPLERSHAEGLFAAGQDETIWRWMTRPPFRDVEDARGWIGEALAGLASGEEVPFAVFEASGAGPIGSTRYMDIHRADRGLEIGWTWLDAAHRRTPVNTECKFLLLRHAFEALGAHRVMFKTDLRNEISRRAIERLGAVQEGIFRKHRITRGGVLRHSVYYSIVDDEWPLVRERLEGMMRR